MPRNRLLYRCDAHLWTTHVLLSLQIHSLRATGSLQLFKGFRMHMLKRMLTDKVVMQADTIESREAVCMEEAIKFFSTGHL